jgi:hypothetical protein
MTKRSLRDKFFDLGHMVIKGCEDDELGEMSNVHRYPTGSVPTSFTITPPGGESHDPCPFSKYPLKNRYFLTYSVRLKNQ